MSYFYLGEFYPSRVMVFKFVNLIRNAAYIIIGSSVLIVAT